MRIVQDRELFRKNTLFKNSELKPRRKSTVNNQLSGYRTDVSFSQNSCDNSLRREMASQRRLFQRFSHNKRTNRKNI